MEEGGYNLKPKLWAKSYFIKQKFQIQMSVVQDKCKLCFTKEIQILIAKPHLKELACGIKMPLVLNSMAASLHSTTPV